MALSGYSVPETLTDDAGNALKGITVTVTGPSAYSGTAVSNASTGLLRLGPLPPGDYTVTYNGRSVTVPVVASAADIVAEAATAAPGLAPVQSVAGRTGAVSLAKADVGLGNVDNTADASKPVSTAQAAANAAVQAAAVQRSNHTGTQLASTISDFSSAAVSAGASTYCTVDRAA